MSNLIIHMTMDNYIEMVERSQAKGIRPGESMQEVLDEMIQEGTIKTVVKTERSEEQIIKDLSKHWKVGDLREDQVNDCVWCNGTGRDLNGEVCEACGGE